ncbi:MAG TPA: MarR family winged helix-turn-helix transcriptional regulator [Tepidisphaeraceae bacterium]|jgi:DNA-binding MarR family transcriptional regulator|nr:MarR family winged helix-turn-helix transcriptional regulator [Tepidisphaeraceae bacterium]
MDPHEKPSPPVPSAICNGFSADDALSTWRQMVHTYLKLQRKVEEMLIPHGLVLSQFEALAKVAMNPGVIQQDLVKHLVVTKGNVGALVDRLEEGGLIERRPDPEDRRANRLFVTETGGTMIAEIFEKHQVLVREMFRPLNSNQRKTLGALLRELEPQ